MTPAAQQALSKYLSLVLRHQPEAADITLDGAGWVAIADLIAGAQRMGRGIADADLRAVVAHSDKQRFTLSADGLSIRAAQGHSVAVDLGLEARVPPDTLYHGTGEGAAPSILTSGLSPRQRQHVHLSADPETARKVGARYGRPVVFTVYAQAAHAEGQPFWIAANGVWLTQALAPDFLYLPPVRGAE